MIKLKKPVKKRIKDSLKEKDLPFQTITEMGNHLTMYSQCERTGTYVAIIISIDDRVKQETRTFQYFEDMKKDMQNGEYFVDVEIEVKYHES